MYNKYREYDLFLDQLGGIDLQWFAAEDEGRTEEPSEYKIRKAREEGKVARSQDLSGALVLLFTVIALALLGRYMITNMLDLVGYFMGNAGQIDIVTDSRVRPLFFRFIIQLGLPIGVVGFLVALVSNFLQVGPLFTLKPLTPDFSRILPRFGQYLKKSIFSAEAGFNLFKSFVKLLLIGAVAYFNIRSRLGYITNMLNISFVQSAIFIARTAFSILIQVSILMVVLALFDYMFQRRKHHESLKMTRQEVREERKSQEGDPLVRSRLRKRMQSLLLSNMARNVPNADVVITNPTHFAVALQYTRETMNAPTVIAKGQDNLAQQIREIAEANDVPIFENRPLARALHAEVEIGDIIPEKFYEAVVTVLKQVYRLRQGVR